MDNSGSFALKPLIAQFASLKRRLLYSDAVRWRLARGSLWAFTSGISVQVASLLASIVSAHLLGQTGFGELAMVRSTILMFGVLAGTGLGSAATKYVAELRDIDPRRAGALLGLLLNLGFLIGGLGTMVCFLLSSQLAEAAFNAPGLGTSLRIGSLLLLLNTLNGIQMGGISGMEAFQVGAWLSLMDALLNLLLATVGAWAFGVNGVMGGLLAAAAVTYPIKHYAMRAACRRAGVPISHGRNLQEVLLLLRFVVPAILAGLAVQPFEWLAKVLLAHRVHGFDQVALFTSAQAWSLLVQFLPQQLAIPLMPIMANLFVADNRATLRKTIFTGAFGAFALGIIVSAPMAFGSRWIMRRYGASFEAGASTLTVLAVTYAFAVITMVSTAALTASGRMWLQAWHKIVWGLSMLLAASLLIHRGALGLAMAYCIGNLVYLVFQIQALLRLLPPRTHSTTRKHQHTEVRLP